MIKRVDFYSMGVAAILVTGWLAWSDAVKKEVPASTWFEVKNISVPNFVEGDDPMMIYDRKIIKPFHATWSVEVHRANDAVDYAYCYGSGNQFYEPKEILPKSGVTLSWFIGKDCKLPEGQYTLQASWEIRPEGYPTKIETYTSNLFRVLPKGAQLYLTPEQAAKVRGLPNP